MQPLAGGAAVRMLAAIGILAVVTAVGAAVFFFGGYVNVAAGEPDPSIVNWALMKIRMASIGRRARDTSPVDLDSLEVVRAGARAFLERGCANCERDSVLASISGLHLFLMRITGAARGPPNSEFGRVKR